MTLAIWRVFRFLVRPLVSAFYRITILGGENVPLTGPALLVSNHVSYVDSIIIGCALSRPPRFVIGKKFYEMPVIGRIVRAFRAIPISETDSPDGIWKSLEAVIAALKAGDLVYLFPEGGMTRTGHVQGFKRGFELVARRAGAPIIPVYLDGLWGSVFSYEGGRYFWKWPKRVPRPVTVAFGAPLPPGASKAQVREAVMRLGAEAFAHRKRDQLPLHAQFWRSARKMWRRPCMAESTGVELTWGQSLVGALMLARWLDRRCPRQKMIGMMMPASVGAALANIAALIAGRVAVNLNFTGARASIEVAIRRCRLKTVFTSRALLRRAGLPERPEYVYLDELLASLPRRDKVLSYVLAAATPTCLAERWLMRRGDMDDLATVMFTSGSMGDPKGVMLSHHNIASNIEAFSEVLRFGPEDTMAGVLPPFHSFGFTATLWAPLTRQMRVAYHPNPLDAKGVGRLVEKHRATVIAGTSSFFAVYVRGCEPGQFRSLRLAVAGGQKLAPSVAEAFEKRFGLALSEGYGCTELSPVVAVNVEDVRDGKVSQAGTRGQSVGRPLPGLAIRIVDLSAWADRETLKPAPEGAAGIVLVKGPSVMLRYMDDARATAAAIRDGWYVTADIGMMDEDGFLYIQDRVSRFSKIGGEMVPHTAVEEALMAAAGPEERRFAVVTLPDRLRGEKLAVVYSGPELDFEALLRKAAGRGIPALWLPSPRDFHRVENVPLLPTGKPDLVAARKIAEERQT